MFGEKKQEKNKAGKMVEVWYTDRYEQSKTKAMQVMSEFDDIHEGDFWILKNETKSGTIMYSGLILSHNACLKINEALPVKDRFNAECVTVDKEGYGDSLVFTYCNPEQGIYEVGEASRTNCKNPYPYAMALKRCFDRVVLKASKIAFDGIYSESESDDFKMDKNPSESNLAASNGIQDKITPEHIHTLNEIIDEMGRDRAKLLSYYGKSAMDELTEGEYGDALNILTRGR